MHNYIVYGDIEGEKALFNNVVNDLEQWKDNITNSISNHIVFLGDLFSMHHIDESIKSIEYLLNYFEIPIKSHITPGSNSNYIYSLFDKLYETKEIYKYKDKYPQFLSSNPTVNTCKKPISPVVFIFGNKEVEFMKMMKYSIRNTHDLNKQTYNGLNIRSNFIKDIRSTEPMHAFMTYEQLNILYNYLEQCIHYILDDKFLYIHCYMNFIRLPIEGKKEVKNIICGHNKGFGIFHEERKGEYMNCNIYMNDLTKYDKQIPNCIYFYVHNDIIEIEKVKRFPNGQFTLK